MTEIVAWIGSLDPAIVQAAGAVMVLLVLWLAWSMLRPTLY